MSIPQWFTDMMLTIPKLKDAGQLTDPPGNLGLGFLYYSLVRIFKPQNVVVIGSHRGFSPLMFGRALHDENNGGKVTFIDPSFADDHWKNPEEVQKYFRKYGVLNITHHCITTQTFSNLPVYKEICKQRIGILMVDGLHTADQASLDHSVFASCLDGPALFHDTMLDDVSTMYQEPYRRSVGTYLANMEKSGMYNIFHIPIEPGLAVVLRKDFTHVGQGR